jgi:hypothetical protein
MTTQRRNIASGSCQPLRPTRQGWLAGLPQPGDDLHVKVVRFPFQDFSGQFHKPPDAYNNQ